MVVLPTTEIIEPSFYENSQMDFWHFSGKIGVSMKKGDFYERNRMVRLF